MTDSKIEMVKKLGKKIENECYLDNIDLGCSAVDTLAAFYNDPNPKLVILVSETLTQLIDICICDEISEYLLKTIKHLEQGDKRRSLGSRA